MKQKPFLQHVGDFIAGKGFYIVLFLCVATIGISGYFLFRGLDSDVTVGATAQVTVTPTLPPISTQTPHPTAKPTPTPTPPPIPSAKPAPAALVFTSPGKGENTAGDSMEALAYDETMADWRTHSGLDIGADLGTQVLATARGTVTAIYDDDLMGTTVTVDHGGGLVSQYANLAAKPTVKAGDAVETGTILGSVGNTALAETMKASHLHFAIEKNGTAVDPILYLPDVT
ncbi:MAG: M23 family metallopeptidase [Oscillospiraceae bacterium]